MWKQAEEAFHHPMDSMDNNDLDDTTEKRMVVTLSQYADDPLLWQSESIGIWRQMVDAIVEYHRLHPSQQVTVQQHYPELFEYLAEQPDMVLTPYETEYSIEDQWETIAAHRVLIVGRLE